MSDFSNVNYPGNIQWQHPIAQWQVSGLSQADYCRQQALSAHQLSYWKRKFQPPCQAIAYESVTGFVDWYNQEHRHRGIQFVTPEQRHTGEHREILKQRQAVYKDAKAKKPERWSRNTRNRDWQAEVCLNTDTTVH
jgi:hypothetical protein